MTNDEFNDRMLDILSSYMNNPNPCRICQSDETCSKCETLDNWMRDTYRPIGAMELNYLASKFRLIAIDIRRVVRLENEIVGLIDRCLSKDELSVLRDVYKNGSHLSDNEREMFFKIMGDTDEQSES